MVDSLLERKRFDVNNPHELIDGRHTGIAPHIEKATTHPDFDVEAPHEAIDLSETAKYMKALQADLDQRTAGIITSQQEGISENLTTMAVSDLRSDAVTMPSVELRNTEANLHRPRKLGRRRIAPFEISDTAYDPSLRKEASIDKVITVEKKLEATPSVTASTEQVVPPTNGEAASPIASENAAKNIGEYVFALDKNEGKRSTNTGDFIEKSVNLGFNAEPVLDDISTAVEEAVEKATAMGSTDTVQEAAVVAESGPTGEESGAQTQTESLPDANAAAIEGQFLGTTPKTHTGEEGSATTSEAVATGSASDTAPDQAAASPLEQPNTVSPTNLDDDLAKVADAQLEALKKQFATMTPQPELTLVW